jgi:LCP family protein required for cell wall assembly
MGKHEQEKSKTKALKIIGIIFLVLVTILVIVAGIGLGFVYSKLGKMEVQELDETDIGIDETIKVQLSKYRNIAIFGIDSRQDDYGLGNRSDCIIIASLNQETNDIKLISLYRDTYMKMNENKREVLDKITHAYSYGGAQNAVKALNTNLDLNITEYVTVNFDAVVAAVDAMGGITLDIDSSELKYINDYISATSSITGVKSSQITRTGRQTLDGVQAVAYSRIRYTAGGEHKRTERMRTVLEAMLTKAKTISLGKLNKLVDTILPRVSTNITLADRLELIPSISSFNIGESIGWPYETKGTTTGIYYGIPVTLESNVIQLHKEVFGELEYVPSETVKNISDQIIKKTGYNK